MRGALLGAAIVSAATVAQAAPCGRPDVDLTFPPFGAREVPQNAILAAHYRAPADYQAETVTLVDPDGRELGVDVSYDAAESMLRAVPLEPLRAGEHHVAWPALRGVATSVGLGQTTTFTVGVGVDGERPSFSGVSDIAWDLSREDDPCTDGLEDRFTYQLELGEVSDDQANELLSVVVFETRSPTRDDGAPKELAVLPLDENGRVHVERASTRAGKVCFAAVVRDLVLNTSGGGDQEVCVKTTEPPFFAGCALTRSGSTRADGWLVLALLGALGLRRRRRPGRVHVALLGALGAVACKESFSEKQPPKPVVPQASEFVCDGERCTQRHVRLPDDGEWRCADFDGVALCAGGEPAAGVVRARSSRGYRCGVRPSERDERVCVDPAPDYPNADPSAYRCRFDSEHGLVRECRPREGNESRVARVLPPGAPNCWLDADCTDRCDRGFCRGPLP